MTNPKSHVSLSWSSTRRASLQDNSKVNDEALLAKARRHHNAPSTCMCMFSKLIKELKFVHKYLVLHLLLEVSCITFAS